MCPHADNFSKNNSQPAAESAVAQRTKRIPAAQIEDNRPQAVAQKKLQETVNKSARTSQLKEYQAMADLFVSNATQNRSTHQAIIPQVKTQTVQRIRPVIQRKLYKGPADLKKGLIAINDIQLSQSEIESVSREFPNWYTKTHPEPFSSVDFSEEQLFDDIHDMIYRTDTFTNQEGEDLSKRINETSQEQFLVGYRAKGEPKPNKEGVKPFGKDVPISSQLGDGLYVAKDFKVAMEYANQYVAQGMIGVIQEVYLNVGKIKKTIDIKGISVKEWWKQYNKVNDDTWDVVVAALSGKVNTIQYKINPKRATEGLYTLKDVKRVEVFEEGKEKE